MPRDVLLLREQLQFLLTWVDDVRIESPEELHEWLDAIRETTDMLESMQGAIS